MERNIMPTFFPFHTCPIFKAQLGVVVHPVGQDVRSFQLHRLTLKQLSSEVFLSSLPSLAVALKWSIFVIITLNFQVGTVLGISHQNSWLKIFHLSYFFHPI